MQRKKDRYPSPKTRLSPENPAYLWACHDAVARDVSDIQEEDDGPHIVKLGMTSKIMVCKNLDVWKKSKMINPSISQAFSRSPWQSRRVCQHRLTSCSPRTVYVLFNKPTLTCHPALTYGPQILDFHFNRCSHPSRFIQQMPRKYP